MQLLSQSVSGGAVYSGFGMLPLVIILLLAAGLIVAFIKSKTLGRWIIGIFVLSLVMLVMSMATYREAVEVSSSPSPTRDYSTDGVSGDASAGSDNSTPSIWMPGAMENFEADVYPSIPAAARALARMVAQKIPNMISDPKNQPKVIIQYSHGDPAHKTQTLDGIVQGLRAENDSLIIEWADSNIEPLSLKNYVTEVIILKVSLVGSDSRSINLGTEKILQTSGTVSLEARGKAGQLAISNKYTQKQWLENFADFKNRLPDLNWILARSNTAAGSDSIAHSQAEQDAVNQIWDQLHLQNRRLKSIRIDLREHGLIVDSFTQSFSGTAGPIWREALLIDASPEKLIALQATIGQEDKTVAFYNDAKRRVFLQQLLSLLGMIAIVCVIYVFINFATKGYYKSSLIGLSALLIIVGVVLVFVLGLNPFHTPKVNSVSITPPPYSLITPIPPTSPTSPTPPTLSEEPTPPRPQTP